ncbi:hypothetical protein CCUS01_00969 [Colletotrichum cuscutae]|uniref:Uncharacterized protein n=1 Tax=Colletotrichum cuscutae TaxID=1209917 RepID=A0AAI9Y351_9PEZI|nr:hypothetical protein CCUS01_00969 [Colletotrichum cuscutae]
MLRLTPVLSSLNLKSDVWIGSDTSSLLSSVSEAGDSGSIYFLGQRCTISTGRRLQFDKYQASQWSTIKTGRPVTWLTAVPHVVESCISAARTRLMGHNVGNGIHFPGRPGGGILPTGLQVWTLGLFFGIYFAVASLLDRHSDTENPLFGESRRLQRPHSRATRHCVMALTSLPCRWIENRPRSLQGLSFVTSAARRPSVRVPEEPETSNLLATLPPSPLWHTVASPAIDSGRWNMEGEVYRSSTGEKHGFQRRETTMSHRHSRFEWLVIRSVCNSSVRVQLGICVTFHGNHHYIANMTRKEHWVFLLTRFGSKLIFLGQQTNTDTRAGKRSPRGCPVPISIGLIPDFESDIPQNDPAALSRIPPPHHNYLIPREISRDDFARNRKRTNAEPHGGAHDLGPGTWGNLLRGPGKRAHCGTLDVDEYDCAPIMLFPLTSAESFEVEFVPAPKAPNRQHRYPNLGMIPLYRSCLGAFCTFTSLRNLAIAKCPSMTNATTHNVNRWVNWIHGIWKFDDLVLNIASPRFICGRYCVLANANLTLNLGESFAVVVLLLLPSHPSSRQIDPKRRLNGKKTPTFGLKGPTNMLSLMLFRYITTARVPLRRNMATSRNCSVGRCQPGKSGVHVTFTFICFSSREQDEDEQEKDRLSWLGWHHEFQQIYWLI